MGCSLHVPDLSQGRPVRTPWRAVGPAAGVRPHARASSAQRARALLILALVFLAHGLAFWLAASRIPKVEALRTAPDNSRAVEIELVPMFARRSSPQRPSAARTVRPLEPRAPAPALPPVVEQPSPPAAIPTAPANQAAQGQLRDEAVRHALQSIVGCGDPDAHGLTREQQANCFRKARPGAPIGAPLSPAEQAAFDADKKREGFLVRTPKNGCQPRVADRPGILSGRGGTGSMAASTEGGVSCAWSF